MLIQSLIEETSRQASKQIEHIENERSMKVRRSQSRSSHKNRAVTDSHYSSAKPSPCQNFVVDEAHTANMRGESSHYCPKFEVDLTSLTQGNTQKFATMFDEIASTSDEKSPMKPLTNSRPNKFEGLGGTAPGGSGANYNAATGQRSNMSLSITRKNRDAGAASDTLNKLV